MEQVKSGLIGMREEREEEQANDTRCKVEVQGVDIRYFTITPFIGQK